MQKTMKSLFLGGLVFSLFFFAFLVIAIPQDAHAAMCLTDSDCGTNGFVGEQFCQGDKNLFGNYLTYTCNNPGSTYSSCTSSKTPQLVRTCNTDQKCKQGIWFIGCAVDTETGGTNGSGTTGYVNASSYDYLRCVGSSVYWFDRYGNQKNLYQTCGYNQTCSHDSCVTNTQQANCTNHAIRGCLNNSVYWYNSCGTQQEVYQNCSASGQTCREGVCGVYQGSTGTGTGTGSGTGTTASTASYITVKTKENLVITILGRKETDSAEFKKNISVSGNDKINFLIIVKNTSDKSLDNTSVKVDLTNNLKYDGNLKIDNIGSSENVVSGINIGNISKGISKTISFSVLVSADGITGTAKVTGNITSGKVTDSDSLTLSADSSQVATSNSNNNINTASLSGSLISNLVKGWYIWGILLLILIFLFIAIFRKLSSNQ